MLRPLLVGSLCALALGSQDAPQAPRRASTAEEQAVVREITKIRMFPREYAKYLRALGTRFKGTLWRLRDHPPIRTKEGRKAVEEAAAFLETVTPIPGVVAFSEGLHQAAMDHVQDTGPKGLFGHKGVDGSSPAQRIGRHGEGWSLTGEVINYGDELPRMTVIQLVIDDGVPDRGHRKNLFNPAFKVAGAAIGPHAEYGTMTVVDLADAFAEKAP
jgi:uncharacterized protein YkwD